MSHLRNVFNLDSFVEICALGQYKSPNITKYDTVCLNVTWACTRSTEGSPPTEPASREGIRMEPGNQTTKLCISGIVEQNCFLVRREHIRMNMVHTSVRSVLLECFSGSCYQSEMAAIKCEICPTDIGLHSDNLAIQLQCPKLALNRI